MATQTENIIELETLNHDGVKLVVPDVLQGSASSIAGQPGPSSALSSDDAAIQPLPLGRSLIVVIQLAGLNFIPSYSNGLVVVGIPAIAADLGLHSGLLLWPMSVYALTCGSCLLLGGAVADVIGVRIVNLVGCFLTALFLLVCGFSQTGIQLIMFRAMQGIAAALALPSSMSIISRSIETGRRRNIAFATLGLSLPLGFSCGLVLGGVFIDGPGWRTGMYIGGAITFCLFVIGIWALPKDVVLTAGQPILRRLATEIDWVGAIVASTSIALLSYVLAMLSADITNIKQPANIVLLILSVAFLVAFVFWMQRQERLNRPALIPNSLWKNKIFTTICLVVFLSYAVVNSLELFSSLFFQEVQGLSALQASIRILPNMMLGIVMNFATGLVVNKIPAVYIVLGTSVLCAGAPLLMAVINPAWPYWYDAFFAQLLSPISVDVLFTIGILIISGSFPVRTQALAGAVFNTLAQLGTSIGMCTMQIISVVVTRDSRFQKKNSPEALMEGYRATFWTMFGWTVTACVIGAFGLRKLGKVGEKRD